MAIRVIDDSKLQNIAVAIQAKDNGGQMTVDEMPGRIANIPTGGTLIPKTITENGVYNASSDNADGYDVVTVDVLQDPNANFNAFMNNTLTHYSTTATSIPNNCFRDKTAMIDIDMPNVTSIENNAFWGCTNLSLTSLPASLTYIGESAFRVCSNLEISEIPNGISGISNSAFYGCSKISITKFPNSITSIFALAFSNCINIPFIDVSEMTNIPRLTNANAFSNTTFPFYFHDQQQINEWAAATNWSSLSSRFQIKPSGVS